MLNIRSDQIEVFKKAAVHGFEQRMLEHLHLFFPRHCELMGESQLCKVIRLGIIRAQEYGIEAERDVCFFISLMLMLGSDFDNDLQLPWATAILHDRALAGHPLRMENLYARAMKHLDQVAGPYNEHAERVLRMISERSPKELLPAQTEGFADDMEQRLASLYAEKFAAVGATNIRQLIEVGTKTARRYGITSPQGTGLIIGMMFLLGSHFDEDPQFAWAAAILNEPTITNPAERVRRLYQEAMTWLRHWLD